jgi:hypothetical protein
VTALTLTPNTEAATIALVVTGAPAGDVTITRVDANGANPVRRQTGHVPSGGGIIVIDYEPAMVGTVRYDVYDSALVTTSASTTLDTPGMLPRIAQVQLPAVVAVPDAVTGYDAARSSATVVHWVEGRQDPVVILRPAHTRQGTLTAWASSYAAGEAILDVLAPGVILMLRQADHAGMDMYLAVIESRVSPLDQLTDGWSWAVNATYVEVKPPTLPLLGAAGWTFADVTAGYVTFASVVSSFATFTDLAIGHVWVYEGLSGDTPGDVSVDTLDGGAPPSRPDTTVLDAGEP